MKSRLRNKLNKDVVEYSNEERKALRLAAKEARMLAASGAIAAKIRRRLRILGMSNADFAAKIGAHPPMVSKWLSGRHNFELKTLVDIEKLLDIIIIDRNVIPQTELSQMDIPATLNNAVATAFQTHREVIIYSAAPQCISQQEALRPLSNFSINVPTVKEEIYG